MTPISPILSEEEIIETAGESPMSEVLDKTRDYLLKIFHQIQTRENTTRENIVRELKYYDLLYQGLQVFWNTERNDWDRIDRYIGAQLPDNSFIDPSITSKVINIMRPYGEAIATAMATGTPKVNYFPQDADKPEDIKTAKIYTNIEKIIASTNTIDIKLLKCILTWWKQGLVAAYIYSHTDYCYGSYKKAKTKSVNTNIIQNTCPSCGGSIGESYEEISETSQGAALTDTEILDENPGQENEEEGSDILPPQLCPQCDLSVFPQKNILGTGSKEIPDGEEERPKSRQIIDVYGGLNVKIPSHACYPDDIIWVILEEEKHYSLLRNVYPEFFEAINGGETDSESSYERWARSNFEVTSETLEDYVTVRKIWLRPSSYAMLDRECYDFLIEQFPDGVYYVVINDQVVEFASDKLDDHWVFGINPSDNRLILRPGCTLIVPVQELVNEVMSLEVKNLRYSIPTVLADPEFFSFPAYRKMRGEPGTIYPAKLPPDRDLSSIIAEVKTATLPREITELDAKLEKFAQFCSGGMPSVFGGNEGSGTATEYVQKKNQALQRLGIPWKMVNHLYAGAMARAIKLYRAELQENDHFVQKQGTSFINLYITKADLTGQVGEIIPEVSEQFPTTWAEKAARLMELLALNNPVIDNALLHPENASLVARLIGLNDLYIPGDDDRNKELTAISKILRVEQDEMGQIIVPDAPPVDLNVDDPNIHATVIKAFLNSDLGIEIQTSNPLAYMLIQQRLEMYNMAVAQQQMMEEEEVQEEEKGKGKGKGKGNQNGQQS